MEKEIPKLLENHIDYGNKLLKKLVDILEYLSDLYHNTSDVTKIVSDKIYDELEDILRNRSLIINILKILVPK